MKAQGPDRVTLATKLEMVSSASLLCSIYVQNFIEFELIVNEIPVCSVLYSINILTQLETSQLC